MGEHAHWQAERGDTTLRVGQHRQRLTGDIRDRAATLPGGLRALDAIHVATAESLAHDLTCLISYDKRMRDVANTRGLPVASPGMPE